MKTKTKSGKFFVLFKKELRDLITVQTLLPIVILFFVFYFMGNVMGSLMSGDTETVTVQIEQTDREGQVSEAEMTFSANAMIGFIDNDNSELSNYIREALPSVGIMPVAPKSLEPEGAMIELENYDLNGSKVKITTLVVIPSGFGEKLAGGEYAFVDAYSAIDSFGLGAMISGASAQGATGAINSLLAQKLFELYGGDASIRGDQLAFGAKTV
ncbi:MAG: hypothetical protein FWH48_10785 [Oscillospiraceae bacterium]|nr:hypothetical protein [Oscillospiraceae bacterium]